MDYTKGEWIKDYNGTVGHIKAVPEGAEAHNNKPEVEGYKLIPTPTVCRYDVITPSLNEEEKEANAHLIAAAPLQNGQLQTGNECLHLVQKIIVEIAKSCSPEHATLCVNAQSYLSGVIAGNEIALSKAEGSKRYDL